MLIEFIQFINRMHYTFPDCSCYYEQFYFNNNELAYQINIYFDDKDKNLQSWHHIFLESDYNKISDKEKYFENLFESFENIYDNVMEE